jgi:hypothetical protein
MFAAHAKHPTPTIDWLSQQKNRDLELAQNFTLFGFLDNTLASTPQQLSFNHHLLFTPSDRAHLDSQPFLQPA